MSRRTQHAAVVTEGNPSQEEVSRSHDLTRPFAEDLLQLAHEDRFNVIGGLICTYVAAYDDPAAALDQLVRVVRRNLPEVEHQVKRVRSGARPS